MSRDPADEQSFRLHTMRVDDVQGMIDETNESVMRHVFRLRAARDFDGADDLTRQWDTVREWAEGLLNGSQTQPYLFVVNGPMDTVDLLGLFDYDLDQCYTRCDKMAKVVCSPNNFLVKCYAGCDKDPNFVPTIPDVLTPPSGRPSWNPGGGWKKNWKKVVDGVDNWWKAWRRHRK